jgi:taurine dioxygenase
VTFERMTGNIGARVTNVDVRADQPDDVEEMLRRGLLEHGVLVFNTGEPLDDEEHLKLGSMFGEVKHYTYRSQKDANPAMNSIDSTIVPPETYRVNCWHTDGSSQAIPPAAAVLRAITLPPVGGDTMWASMNAAYESLSSHTQRLLDGLQAVHSTAAVTRHFPDENALDLFGEGDRNVHPVIIKDPVTGRRLIYVNSNYTERIVGMSETESDSVLRMLFNHVNTPEFHVRLRWEPDTVAVWDERGTQHRAVADYTEKRVLRRMNIEGGPLVAA